ncbi:MAG: alpha/beta hydrolase [Bdellovibrio sp.]|nr:MAG: alpha/beta hydrolase [Bdellovibrio sp.]
MKITEKKTGYFKSFDGTKIYYEVRGEGPPLVFCYGIGCLINHWQHQIKYFSQNYKTIVFDYRGHHKSEVPKNIKNISIKSLAKDLKGLLDHLEISKAGFLGHSFGAQVLLCSYEMFPEYFHNLTFINGFGSNPIRGMFKTDLVSQFFEVFKSGYDLAPGVCTKLWKLATKNPIAIRLSALAGGFNLNLTHLKDVEIYARGISSIDLTTFLTLFEDMIQYDARPLYPNISIPTLIIGGKNDSVTPMKYQEEMHKQIKNSELLMVPYGSHCTQLDLPDFVSLRIEKFLKNASFEKDSYIKKEAPLKPLPSDLSSEKMANS